MFQCCGHKMKHHILTKPHHKSVVVASWLSITSVLQIYFSEKQYGNIVMKIKESKFTDIMWNIIYIYLDMVFLKFTCIVIVQDKCLSFRKGVMVIWSVILSIQLGCVCFHRTRKLFSQQRQNLAITSFRVDLVWENLSIFVDKCYQNLPLL